ncbi:hypothetical protein C8F01DRAFT_197357 [Mycena amicta]|nr:hypothetical protein C8F01DRAFT_197357 [Mycena amicta]
MQDAALSQTPCIDRPLGTDTANHLLDKLLSLIEDVKVFSAPHEPIEIAPSYYEYMIYSLISVLRTKKGKVVVLTILKDSTKEEMTGITGGYFSEYAGPGPSEHRHFLELVHNSRPFYGNFPFFGNLSPALIAAIIGCILDFWPFIRNHRFYTIHILFLARVLDVVRPLLILGQSNPVAKLLLSGFLAQPRDSLGTAEFFGGHTTEDFFIHLPDLGHQKFQKAEFITVIGEIYIISIAPRRLCLFIPDGHCGSLKYKPVFYEIVCQVHFLVANIQRVATHVLSEKLEHCGLSEEDWEDEELARPILEEVVLICEAILVDIYRELNELKPQLREQRYVAGFPEKLATSHRKYSATPTSPAVETTNTPWAPLVDGYVRHHQPRGMLARPRGEEREKQLAELTENSIHLRSRGMPHDPFKLESFGRQIGSPAFRDWFLRLEDGVSIYLSANSEGKSAESAGNAQRTRVLILDHQPGAEDPEKQRVRHILNLMTFSKSPPSPYELREWENSRRYAVCAHCSLLVTAINNAVPHVCPACPTPLNMVFKNFTLIERFLFPHDAEAYLGTLSADEKAALLKDLGLVEWSVGTVITKNRTELKTTFPNSVDYDAILNGARLSLTCSIYAPPDCSASYLLTMAIDVMLREHTPGHQRTKKEIAAADDFFEPIGEQRIAWTVENVAKLRKWIAGRNSNHPYPLYFSSCGASGRCSPQYVFMSDKASKRKGLKITDRKC